MSNKILAIIFGIIIILAIIFGYLQTRENADNSKQANDIKIPTVNLENVNLISVSDSTNNISLELQEDVWMVEGKQVDKSLIENIWDTMNGVSLTGPVATNPDNHKNFSVDEETGTSVSFFNGDNNILSIVVGKIGPNFNSTYIRLKDRNEVFLAQADIAPLFPLEANAWLDKTVTSLNQEEVTRIEFTNPDNLFTLEKTESIETQENEEEETTTPSWSITINKDTRVVENEKINEFFTMLNPLTSIAFLTPEEKEEFNKTEEISVISFFNEEKNIIEKLILLDREKGNPWIYSEARDEFFAIPRASFDTLSLDPENL